MDLAQLTKNIIIKKAHIYNSNKTINNRNKYYKIDPRYL